MSYCKMIVMGRLGADPESRTMPSGDMMLKFRMATSDFQKQADGSAGELVMWHSIILYGDQAKRLAPHLRKGQMVYVEGPLRSNKWTTRDGVERIDWQVNARRVEFCERKGREAGQDYAPPAKAQMYAPQTHVPQHNAMGYDVGKSTAGMGSGSAATGDDDDCPF